MATSKKRAGGRKQAKQYRFVKFEHPEFNDAFELPALDGAPVRVIEALNKGDMQAVTSWMEDAGVDQSTIDDFRDLSSDEFEQFAKLWSDGAPVGLGNSSN